MWMSRFTTLSWMACYFSLSNAMTNNKRIFGAAPDPGTYYDFFHMTSDGKVIVLTEYDLMLTLNQYFDIQEGRSDSRGRRKARRDPTYRWTNCIVHYDIDDSLNDPESRTVIQQAISQWERYTCLMFRQRPSARRRIVFRDGPGCNSFVGMQDQPQPIELAKGCRTKEVVVHEIGHAIGFWHEHTRPDRDNYIRINWGRITVPRHNYEKRSSSIVNTYGVPYDYTSIMHYGGPEFETLDRYYQDKIGMAKGLSFKDIKLANLMYQCARVMGCLRRQCPQDGFQFYKNHKRKGTCQCWCDSDDPSDPLILCSDRSRPMTPPPRPTPAPTGAPETTPHSTHAPEPEVECEDMHPDCAQLKREGECVREMMRMKEVCGKTCGFCGKGKGMCMDHEKGCKMAAAAGLCKGDLRETMENLCPASCGVCTTQPDPCEIHEEFMGYNVVTVEKNNNGAISSITGPGVLVILMVTIVNCLCGNTII